MLVGLYNATDGANWTNNTNWLSDASIGEWHGVTTDSGGWVTEIALRENNRSGEIPAELDRLANLTFLYPQRNRLSGEIPVELGNLSDLEWLYLRDNQLSGCIPAGLHNVPGNDLDDLGLPDCGEAMATAKRFDSVSTGRDHTCGVRTDGSVACWGSNEDLDGNDRYGQATPPQGTFTSVSAGSSHTCGVREDGSVACWGFNRFGQARPFQEAFTSVSAGDRHTCGVREGRNRRLLGT